jgi:hypothetical protein
MTKNRKNEFLGLSLAHAGEMAYAEDAPGTCALLGHLNSFFRYLCGHPESVILKDEIRACESYVAIQQISAPSALTVTIDLAEELGETMITRFAVIDLLDRYVVSLRESWSGGVAVKMDLFRSAGGSAGSTTAGGAALQCRLYAEDRAAPVVVNSLS